MTAEETFEREMRPLQEIKDNYEKIILTLDHLHLRSILYNKKYRKI